MKYHYIYRIARTDGKFYIGMHSTSDLDDGYFGSGKMLWKSIQKHGKDQHTKTILEFLPNRKMLKDREREIVDARMLQDPLCFNLQLGGEGGGGFWTLEQQLKCASAGGKISHRLNFAKARSEGKHFTRGMQDKIHSTETKEQMSVSHSGEKNSQFGTCWVTNGVKPIKVKKEIVNGYLEQGYSLGRKYDNRRR